MGRREGNPSIRILLLGGPGVGKGCLESRFTTKSYPPPYDPSLTLESRRFFTLTPSPPSPTRSLTRPLNTSHGPTLSQADLTPESSSSSVRPLSSTFSNPASQARFLATPDPITPISAAETLLPGMDLRRGGTLLGNTNGSQTGTGARPPRGPCTQCLRQRLTFLVELVNYPLLQAQRIRSTVLAKKEYDAIILLYSIASPLSLSLVESICPEIPGSIQGSDGGGNGNGTGSGMGQGRSSGSPMAGNSSSKHAKKRSWFGGKSDNGHNHNSTAGAYGHGHGHVLGHHEKSTVVALLGTKRDIDNSPGSGLGINVDDLMNQARQSLAKHNPGGVPNLPAIGDTEPEADVRSMETVHPLFRNSRAWSSSETNNPMSPLYPPPSSAGGQGYGGSGGGRRQSVSSRTSLGNMQSAGGGGGNNLRRTESGATGTSTRAPAVGNAGIPTLDPFQQADPEHPSALRPSSNRLSSGSFNSNRAGGLRRAISQSLAPTSPLSGYFGPSYNIGPLSPTTPTPANPGFPSAFSEAGTQLHPIPSAEASPSQTQGNNSPIVLSSPQVATFSWQGRDSNWAGAGNAPQQRGGNDEAEVKAKALQPPRLQTQHLQSFGWGEDVDGGGGRDSPTQRGPKQQLIMASPRRHRSFVENNVNIESVGNRRSGSSLGGGAYYYSRGSEREGDKRESGVSITVPGRGSSLSVRQNPVGGNTNSNSNGATTTEGRGGGSRGRDGKAGSNRLPRRPSKSEVIQSWLDFGTPSGESTTSSTKSHSSSPSLLKPEHPFYPPAGKEQQPPNRSSTRNSTQHRNHNRHSNSQQSNQNKDRDSSVQNNERISNPFTDPVSHQSDSDNNTEPHDPNQEQPSGENRQVPVRTAQATAARLGLSLPAMECSAKTGEGVEEAFEAVIRQVLKGMGVEVASPKEEEWVKGCPHREAWEGGGVQGDQGGDALEEGSGGEGNGTREGTGTGAHGRGDINAAKAEELRAIPARPQTAVLRKRESRSLSRSAQCRAASAAGTYCVGHGDANTNGDEALHHGLSTAPAAPAERRPRNGPTLKDTGSMNFLREEDSSAATSVLPSVSHEEMVAIGGVGRVGTGGGQQTLNQQALRQKQKRGSVLFRMKKMFAGGGGGGKGVVVDA